MKKLDFKESLADFKSTNVDPRELIMLFKQDLMLSEVSLSKHFDTIDSRAELNFLRMIEKIKHES